MLEENPEKINIVEVAQIPIELNKLLKFAGLAQSGGEAKSFVSRGLVLVNGQVETKKRKKIVPGDIVEFNGRKFCVAVKESIS